MKNLSSLLFTLFFTIFLIITFVPKPNGLPITTGDEPHYLIMSYSMLYDQDLKLENNYKNNAYHNWYPATKLIGHLFAFQGKNYPLHQPGLSLYVLPFFLIGQRIGVAIFLAFLTALGVLNIFKILQYFVPKRIAIFTTLVVGLTAPVLTYSGLVYPEVMVFFLMSWILKIILDPKFKLNLKNGLLLTILMILIPPLHFKFGLFIGIILLYIDSIMFKKIKLIYLVLFNVIISIGSLGYLVWMYYFFNGNILGPMQAMAAGNKFLPQYIFSGLLGSLIDRENGILIFTPIYIYIFSGFYFFLKGFNKMEYRKKMTRLFIASIVIIQTIFVTMYPDILGGQNPAGRYFLPIIPGIAVILSFGIIEALENKIQRVILAAMTIYMIILSSVIIFHPNLIMPYGGGNNLVTFLLKDNSVIVHKALPNLSKFRRTITTYDFVKGISIFSVILFISRIHTITFINKYESRVENIQKNIWLYFKKNKKKWIKQYKDLLKYLSEHIVLTFFILFLTIYSLGALIPKPIGMAPTNGDEPHYLVMTYSLLHEGDLDLWDNYKNSDYASWYKPPLAPHLFNLGKTFYPLHQPGLSVYLLPAFIVGGKTGATLFIALLAAMGMINIYYILLNFVKKNSAIITTLFVALSSPVFIYSSLLYPEVGVFFLISCILRIILDSSFKLNLKNGILLTVLFWLLPPLHFKFGLLIAIILPYINILMFKKTKILNLIIFDIFVAIGSFGYLVWMYFFLNGQIFEAMRIMAAGNKFLFEYVPSGLLGVLVDRENGVLLFAPVYLYVFIGFSFFFQNFKKLSLDKKMRKIFIVTLIGIHSVFVTMYPDILGGQNPAGRYFLPIIPAVAIILAVSIETVMQYSIHRKILIGIGIYTLFVLKTVLANPMVALPFGHSSPLYQYWLQESYAVIHPYLPNMTKFMRKIEFGDYVKSIVILALFILVSFAHKFKFKKILK